MRHSTSAPAWSPPPSYRNRSGCTITLPSAQGLTDIDLLIGGRGVERGFPDRDLAALHGPDLDAKALHALTGVGIVPLAFPDIAHHIVHQRAEPLSKLVSLLLRPPRLEEFAERVTPAKFRDHAETDDAIFREA